MQTKYRVQIGKGPKGSYQTRYSDLPCGQACFWYAGINIGNGYKKRLQSQRTDGKWVTLKRAIS